MHKNRQQPTPRRMEDVAAVSSRIGRGRTWIHSAVKRGAFPAPVRLSSRCTRWDSIEVDRWIAEQFAKARQ